MIGRMTYELGQGTGPLRGVKVVEIAGIGPGPHACMILADLGADVIRIDRPGGGIFGSGEKDVLNRGRPSVALDLKQPEAVATVLRPRRERRRARRGHAPRRDRAPRPRPRRLPRPQPAAGLRPDDRLGPGRPVEPGGRPRHELHRHHRRAARAGPGPRTGRTSRATSSATSAAARPTSSSASSPPCSRPGPAARGRSSTPRSSTAPPTSTRWRPRFAALGLATGRRRSRPARRRHPLLRRLRDRRRQAHERRRARAAVLRRAGRAAWSRPARPQRPRPTSPPSARRSPRASRRRPRPSGRRSSTAPTPAWRAIIPLTEAYDHPHLAARGTFVEHGGITQPAPAPRFSRTTPTLGVPPGGPGAHTRDALAAWGVDDVDGLIESGAAVQA